MSNNYFRFKQFTVFQDRCAMKVGTDGILLGALASLSCADSRVLDVGTGTGILSLMVAQRCPSARVVALDIDPDAVLQAGDNVAASPWADRIMVLCADFKDFSSDTLFDFLISNLPYFVDSLHCPSPTRSLARHADSLSCQDLFKGAVRCLKSNGRLAVILPYTSRQAAVEQGLCAGFYLSRCVNIYSRLGKPCLRVVLEFGRTPCDCVEEQLVLTDERGQRTPSFAVLTRDFYL